jgi:hypothetical protein
VNSTGLFIVEKNVNVPSKSKKKQQQKLVFCWRLEGQCRK